MTANSNQVTYNGQNQSVSGFTASGLVGGEDESVLTGVSTTGGTGKNAGSYAHTASGTDGNYDITFVDGVLVIEAKPVEPKPIEPKPPVIPSYYPTWANPYQRAIRMQALPVPIKAFEQVEIEVEGQGINLENIQTLGSN